MLGMKLKGAWVGVLANDALIEPMPGTAKIGARAIPFRLQTDAHPFFTKWRFNALSKSHIWRSYSGPAVQPVETCMQ